LGTVADPENKKGGAAPSGGKAPPKRG